MSAKVGAAARPSQSAAPRAAAAMSYADSAAGAAGGIGLAHGFAPASRLRNAASPASDTLTHRGSTVVSAS